MTKYTFNDPEKKLFKKHQGVCKELADTCTNMEIVYVKILLFMFRINMITNLNL